MLAHRFPGSSRTSGERSCERVSMFSILFNRSVANLSAENDPLACVGIKMKRVARLSAGPDTNTLDGYKYARSCSGRFWSEPDHFSDACYRSSYCNEYISRLVPGLDWIQRLLLELDNCVAGIRIMRVPEAPPERMPLALPSTLRNR